MQILLETCSNVSLILRGQENFHWSFTSGNKQSAFLGLRRKSHMPLHVTRVLACMASRIRSMMFLLSWNFNFSLYWLFTFLGYNLKTLGSTLILPQITIPFFPQTSTCFFPSIAWVTGTFLPLSFIHRCSAEDLCPCCFAETAFSRSLVAFWFSKAGSFFWVHLFSFLSLALLCLALSGSFLHTLAAASISVPIL